MHTYGAGPSIRSQRLLTQGMHGCIEEHLAGCKVSGMGRSRGAMHAWPRKPLFPDSVRLSSVRYCVASCCRESRMFDYEPFGAQVARLWTDQDSHLRRHFGTPASTYLWNPDPVLSRLGACPTRMTTFDYDQTSKKRPYLRLKCGYDTMESVFMVPRNGSLDAIYDVVMAHRVWEPGTPD